MREIMAADPAHSPFPALKPNPSRSFLSGGRGDYPKGILPSESMPLDSKNIVCRCSVYFYGQKAFDSRPPLPMGRRL